MPASKQIFKLKLTRIRNRFSFRSQSLFAPQSTCRSTRIARPREIGSPQTNLGSGIRSKEPGRMQSAQNLPVFSAASPGMAANPIDSKIEQTLPISRPATKPDRARRCHGISSMNVEMSKSHRNKSQGHLGSRQTPPNSREIQLFELTS
jgi:hypothetical protein